MNEDEAFIRAIVDNPGVDLPRLVYADWLDDRDDPRGSYLRAEREAIETGDIARLRELAVGLDPVWVARVSRPPVGVCVEAPMFRQAKKPTTNEAIDKAVRDFGVSFPPAYRAFLLNYNGGGFLYPLATPDETAFLNVFAGVRLAKNDFPSLSAFADGIFDAGNGINLRSGLFPIGAPDGERVIYLLGVERFSGDRGFFGLVYTTEEPEESWADPDRRAPAADSFPELLAEFAARTSYKDE